MNGIRSEPIAVIGAGGHARVVVSALKASGYQDLVVYDDDPDTWCGQVLTAPVHGPTRGLEGWTGLAVVALGNNAVRHELAQRFPEAKWLPIVHPAAWVDQSAQILPGAVVCAGAIIQPEAVIGAHVIVNTGATVDHDCILEEFAHVAPGAHLAGAVRIGRGALIGMGSAILPGCTVGDWATIGAGGVVTHDILPGVTAVGVPARPLLVTESRPTTQPMLPRPTL